MIYALLASITCNQLEVHDSDVLISCVDVTILYWRYYCVLNRKLKTCIKRMQNSPSDPFL